MTWTEAWYFMPADRRLRYGDNREVIAGTTHHVTCKPALCRQGLHASEEALDALSYAPGLHVARVALLTPVTGNDKCAATARQYLWVADATEVVLAWSRRVALDVVHLWEPPQVVLNFLHTGVDAAAAAIAAADVVRGDSFAPYGAIAYAAATHAAACADVPACAYAAAAYGSSSLVDPTSVTAARDRYNRWLEDSLWSLK